MNILDRLNRRFGRFAIPNLMQYICVIYGIGFMIQVVAPEIYYYYMDLDPEAILHGHIWRIFTFLFYFPAGGGFSGVFWAIIGIIISERPWNFSGEASATRFLLPPVSFFIMW